MSVNFDKADGLVPAVIQDAETAKVLMVGFMNAEALERTISSGWVTFYSRSRQELWKKGETSGNTLKVVEVLEDCDQDTILVKAVPNGPVCHTGADTCFKEKNTSSALFLEFLRDLIRSRRQAEPESSYTASLFAEGMPRIAQKVGEEAVESVIAAVRGDKERVKEETADLLFHLLVMLETAEVELSDIVEVLRKRNGATASR